MDPAEVQEVVHLVERQKKRLHFAGSMLHVQPADQELRRLPLFQGLSDPDFTKVGTLDFAKVVTLNFAKVYPLDSAKVVTQNFAKVYPLDSAKAVTQNIAKVGSLEPAYHDLLSWLGCDSQTLPR